MPETAGALYIIVMLLPGFVGYLCLAKIYNREISDGFEKTALTILIGAISVPIVSLFQQYGAPNISENTTFQEMRTFAVRIFPAQVATCVVLGVLFGWIANWQIFSKFLILLGASSKAGHAAVVAAAIRRHPESYFRIRLKSGGYLLGHPILYSLDGEEPCLFLEKAAFRRARPDRRHSLPVQIDINGPGIIVVNFDEVLFIELV